MIWHIVIGLAVYLIIAVFVTAICLAARRGDDSTSRCLRDREQ